MTHRRRLVPVAATAVLASAAAALWVPVPWWGAGEGSAISSLPSDGPLRRPPEHGYAFTSPVGVTVTDGLEILDNDGGQPLVIEEVSLVDAEGIELVGAMLAPPPRLMGASTVIRSWPPVRPDVFDEETLVPAEGAVIGTDPEDNEWGWQLLVGMRPTTEGRLLREGVRVVYRVGDERYEVVYPGRVTICTSEEHEVEGSCPDRAPD